MKRKILFVILARKGSKRLRNKNILPLNKKPLICWTIEQTLRLKNISCQSVVSTDSQEIISYGKKYKGIDFIERPQYLSTGSATSIDTLIHLFKKIEYNGYFILLQPTSPLRKDKDIINVYKLLLKGKSPIFSACKSLHNSSLTSLANKYDRFIPLSKKKLDTFYPNGAIYAAHTNWVKKNTTFYSKESYVYYMDQSSSIDIDYKYQFVMAEALIKNYFK